MRHLPNERGKRGTHNHAMHTRRGLNMCAGVATCEQWGGRHGQSSAPNIGSGQGRKGPIHPPPTAHPHPHPHPQPHTHVQRLQYVENSPPLRGSLSTMMGPGRADASSLNDLLGWPCYPHTPPPWETGHTSPKLPADRHHPLLNVVPNNSAGATYRWCHNAGKVVEQDVEQQPHAD